MRAKQLLAFLRRHIQRSHSPFQHFVGEHIAGRRVCQLCTSPRIAVHGVQIFEWRRDDSVALDEPLDVLSRALSWVRCVRRCCGNGKWTCLSSVTRTARRRSRRGSWELWLGLKSGFSNRSVAEYDTYG